MATNSSIEWTEATWNPVAGCSIISPGCSNCYAMRMAGRLQSMQQSKYTGLTRLTGGKAKWNGEVRLDYDALNIPYRWKKGKMIFVNSMSDLFHEAVPIDFIQQVFLSMGQNERHTFQILTKRADRLAQVNTIIDWPNNVWMGVSVESADYLDRIDKLRRTDAKVKFLSLEPLLGPLHNLALDQIDWVIAGGESGPGARPINSDWVRSIRDQCINKKIAFHFKQWGGVNKKKIGRTLDGRTWEQFPNQRNQINSEGVSASSQ